MKNFEKKESNLNHLIDKLGKLNASYSQIDFNSESLLEERDQIKFEKQELEKKNREMLREHKYLLEKVSKLEKELKAKRDLEKEFNKDMDELNQETQSLVEEIEKWQT